MAQHFFEEFRQKKDNLAQLASKAREFGWIDDEREKDIIAKLDADTLTIGVIGQMKCGKSTFLNAFVFENDILPAATTPMTAALSVITYGETAKVLVEFYTKDEWLEQCAFAEQSIQGLSDLEASKVTAAKELVEKSAPIKDSIEDYLGKTREDSLDNIVDYVGAEGKFVSITKAVKIFYPKDYLKGVEIVDTPGFNDPIVSRELRTKEFLKKADVVVMMLYAGRPFDRTDRAILFENVKQCGIGKVIIGVNKYDIPFASGERPEEIKQYVIEEIKKECRQCHDETMLDILKNADPILLSAEMALLSQLPMSKITQSESYSHAYKRYTGSEEYEEDGKVASQLGIPASKLMAESHLEVLSMAIKTMVEQEKYDVLLKKPINAIIAAGLQKHDDLVTEISNTDAQIKILSTPDDELEEKELNLSKAERRLNKMIDGLGDDLNLAIADIAREGRHKLEDAMDESCNKMEKIIEDVGRFKNFNTIKPSLDKIANEFETRKAKKLVEELGSLLKVKLKETTGDFFPTATDIISRFIPDVDSREFVKEAERQMNFQIEDESIFCASNSEEDKSKGIWGYVLDGGVLLAFGFIGIGAKSAIQLVLRGINHDKQKIELLEKINQARFSFDAKPIVDTILISKDNVIKFIKKKFLDELIIPLNDQIAACRTELADKESKLTSAQEKYNNLLEKKATLDSQINSINIIVSAI